MGLSPLPPIEEDAPLKMMELCKETSSVTSVSSISFQDDEQDLSSFSKRKESSVPLDVCPPLTQSSSVKTSLPNKSCLKQLDSDKEEPKRRNHHVAFGDISIRRYDVTLGDNPSVTKGLPLTLDWTFEQQPTIALDEYYEMHGEQQRRLKNKFYINSQKRKALLLEAGFDAAALRHAKKEIQAAQLQRKASQVLSPLQLLWSHKSIVKFTTRRTTVLADSE